MNGHMIDVGPVHEMLAVTRAGMSWYAIQNGIRDLPAGTSVILTDSSEGMYLDEHDIHDNGR